MLKISPAQLAPAQVAATRQERLSSDKSASDALFRYRLDIDGLRGVAVLAVVLFHINTEWLPGGFTGVDIFFIISGYVVTASILRHKSANFVAYITEFYKRRVLRLMPALLVCVFVTVLLTALFVNPGVTGPIFSVAERSLFGWSNNYLIASSSDYFGIGAELNPLTHTWTMGVEEQFYFIFPTLLFLLYGLRRPVSKKRLGLWVMIGVIALSLALCLFYSANMPIRAYYFMPSRFWELAAGSLLYLGLTTFPHLLPAEGVPPMQMSERMSAVGSPATELPFVESPAVESPSSTRWKLLSLQVAAICLILGSFVLISAGPGFPIPGAIPMTIGTLLFIYTGLDQQSVLNRSVAHPFLIYLGKISYSLYLWHWPVFTLFRWTIGLESIFRIVLALLLTTVLSLLSYYYLEQPVRKLKRLRRRQVFAGALAVIFVVGSTCVFLSGPAKGKFYLAQPYAESTWWVSSEEALIEGTPISEENCWNWLDKEDHTVSAAQLDLCTLPPTTPDSPHLFLLGDSHGFSFIPMLAEVREQTGMGITTVANAGCPISLNVLRRRAEGGMYTKCNDYVVSMLALLKERANPGDVVLIASRYRAYLTDAPPISLEDTVAYSEGAYDLFQDDQPISKANAQPQIAADLISIAKSFADEGVNLVLGAPLPEHRMRAEQCLPVWFSAGSGLKPECFVSRTENIAHRQPMVSMLQAVADETPSTTLWDPFDELCPDEQCSHFRKEKPIYRDDDHLSLYGSRSLAPSFIQSLKQLMLREVR
ncbi:MAG: acyltransferase family protein [Cyanobacteria bacterium J06554_11]